MPKFFVSPAEAQGNFLVLTGENAAHAKVLRVQPGEAVVVCDGAGQDLTCVVSDVSPGQVSLVVQSREASRAEPPVFCSVFFLLLVLLGVVGREDLRWIRGLVRPVDKSGQAGVS